MSEHEITASVLRRKKQKSSEKSKHSLKKVVPEKHQPPSQPYINTLLNYLILAISFTAATIKVAKTDPSTLNGLVIWGIFMGVTHSIPGASLDSWLLPVAVGCTFDSRTLVVTMASSLGCRGWFGTLLGIALAGWSRSVPRFCYVAPVVVRWMLSTLEFSGASLDSNERILISTGVGAFVFIGASGLGLPWVIITSALVGFIPCLWTVPRAVVLIRNYRQRIDTRKLQFWANVTYGLYFGCAGATFLLFGGQDQIRNALEILAEEYKTIVWWFACLGVAFSIASFAPHFELDSRRKLWHLTTVAMFMPTRTYRITSLALAGALALFLKLELVRAAALPPFGPLVHQHLKLFTDQRDTRGPLVISHIYLLLGIACPIFAGNGSPAGVVCLGLGDTFASQVGRRYGRLKVFGPKTLEGTLAFFGAVFASVLLVHPVGILRAAIISCLCALLEAVSPINDNLILPMCMLLFERLAVYY